MHLDIIHIPQFLKNFDLQKLFETIKTESFKDQSFLNQNNSKMPRLIKWYGEKDYSYANIFHPALKIPDFIIPLLDEVNNYLELENIKSKMNSVLLNYYRDGKDKINYHSDDVSQIGKNPVICSVSLGETRKFSFRNKKTKEKIEIQLGNGDLCIMKGNTQEDWEHSILQEPKKGERINLTFRNTLYQVKDKMINTTI